MSPGYEKIYWVFSVQITSASFVIALLMSALSTPDVDYIFDFPRTAKTNLNAALCFTMGNCCGPTCRSALKGALQETLALVTCSFPVRLAEPLHSRRIAKEVFKRRSGKSKSARIEHLSTRLFGKKEMIKI